MPVAQTQWKHLERDPKSSYRQLSIKGRRVRARTLYGLYVNSEFPRTIEQIAAEYQLPVEAVAEAIAYCKSNPPEIELDWQRTQAIMAASGENDPGYKDSPQPKPVPPDMMAKIKRKYG